MRKELRIGLATLHIEEERCNTFVKDKQGVSRPLKFGVSIGYNEYLSLRDYMNLTGKDIIEASQSLLDCDAVLIGSEFTVYFYDQVGVDKFLEKHKA